MSQKIKVQIRAHNNVTLLLLSIILNLFVQNTSATQAGSIPDFSEKPKIRWVFNTGSAIFSSPVESDNIVFTGGLDSILFAIDISTGKEKWRFRTKGEIRSNPCINGDKIFLNGGDGTLYALNKKTGALLWKFDTMGERKYDFADYFQSTPIIDNNISVFWIRRFQFLFGECRNWSDDLAVQCGRYHSYHRCNK